MNKIIFFIITFCLFLPNMEAQDNQILINAGVKLNNVFESPADNSSFIFGSAVGLTYNKYLSNSMFLSSGLFIDGKGYGVKIDIGTESMDYRVRIFYLDLPVKYNYVRKIGNQSIIVGIGPYIGYGLWGNISTNFMGDSEIKSVKWGNTGGDYDGTADHKRLDFGFTGNISYQVKKISIGLDYQIGVVNMVPDGLGGGERNNTFGVHLGYLIKK